MSRTYAKIDERGMESMLKRLRDQAPEIRHDSLTVGAEGLNSEAQIESPVLTGTTQSAHTVFQANEDEAVLGVNTDYALAVHETHPTKRRWYVNSVQRNFNRVMGGAITVALKRAAGRVRRT